MRSEQPLNYLGDELAVSGQIDRDDLPGLAALGIRTLVCLRPDEEEGEFPTSVELRSAAQALDIELVYAPFPGTSVTDEALDALARALSEPAGTTLAYCRSGRRVAITRAVLALGDGRTLSDVLNEARRAGFELDEFGDELLQLAKDRTRRPTAAPQRFDVVVVGGGSAGLGTIASLRKRRPDLSIAVVEPSTEHHYQPGLTLVGTGWFDPERITRPEADLIPQGVSWIQQAVSGFEPERDEVCLEDGSRVAYGALVVASGLTLDWEGIDGARDALGRRSVCCNYSPVDAPYTWECVQALRSGTALFTQPAMPIKCAGAPQKAMYLSCDRWGKSGVLGQIDVQFHNAGGVLFGVEHFVPALMEYVERYGIDLRFASRLVAIDGAEQIARFEATDAEGAVQVDDVHFDFLHFVPPQRAPAFVASSPLADAAGWLAVDPHTLRHVNHANVFGAGDVVGTTNAKTMAAARKHAPVVAENLIAQLDGRAAVASYDGYGACPLTVEGGRVVLAEFGYGGTLLPTFPIEPAVPRHSQWFLKRHLMPWIYWDLMLKGREWFAQPKPLDARAAAL